MFIADTDSVEDRVILQNL